MLCNDRAQLRLLQTRFKTHTHTHTHTTTHTNTHQHTHTHSINNILVLDSPRWWASLKEKSNASLTVKNQEEK